MNKPYRISAHKVLELSLQNTVYQDGGRGGGGGVKKRGGGGWKFFPPKKG